MIVKRRGVRDVRPPGSAQSPLSIRWIRPVRSRRVMIVRGPRVVTRSREQATCCRGEYSRKPLIERFHGNMFHDYGICGQLPTKKNRRSGTSGRNSRTVLHKESALNKIIAVQLLVLDDEHVRVVSPRSPFCNDSITKAVKLGAGNSPNAVDIPAPPDGSGIEDGASIS